MTIYWTEIKGPASMPDEPGNYLCAFSDGSVETFTLNVDDLAEGGWRSAHIKVTHWADHPEHPNIALAERRRMLDMAENQRRVGA